MAIYRCRRCGPRCGTGTCSTSRRPEGRPGPVAARGLRPGRAALHSAAAAVRVRERAGLLLFSVLQRGSSARHCGLLYLVLVADTVAGGGASHGPAALGRPGLREPLAGRAARGRPLHELPGPRRCPSATASRRRSICARPVSPRSRSSASKEDVVSVVAGLLDQPFYFPASAALGDARGGRIGLDSR